MSKKYVSVTTRVVLSEWNYVSVQRGIRVVQIMTNDSLCLFHVDTGIILIGDISTTDHCLILA